MRYRCSWLEGFNIEGGDDCDDTDDQTGRGTFPMSALEDGTECMKDVDDDGYGDDNPIRENVVAGTDCDDDSVDVYPGLSVVSQ